MDEQSIQYLRNALYNLEQWEDTIEDAPAIEQFAIEKLRSLLPEIRKEIKTLLAEHERWYQKG